tara:strand:+ start:415 stop:816 length:402 start_codon:yes stop_codon:yes gene_type:complete
MSLHGFALQERIYSTLNGDSTLGALIQGVFDSVPDGQSLPVVTIGTQSTSDNGTKTLDARDYIFNVDVYSDYRGMKEIKNIQKEIYRLLHESSLSVSGASFVNCRCEFTTDILEDDGVTRHGVMRFRAYVTDN